jgi:hypothetical protein
MATGIHPIPPSIILDRELRCQGSSLEAWAAAHGVAPAALREVLDGLRPDHGLLRVDLAATLGVSASALARSA